LGQLVKGSTDLALDLLVYVVVGQVDALKCCADVVALQHAADGVSTPFRDSGGYILCFCELARH
jgi:hypothetical protein